MRRLNVLMISYACSPKRGSEHLLGWNWAARLAERGHGVTVLTSAHRIGESEGQRPAGLDLLAVDDRRFAFLRKTGLLGQQLYFQLWVRAAARQARQLAQTQHVDVVHQCTFHTYRWPFRPALWGNVASVWGPVAGLEHIPWRFLSSLGWQSWIEIARSLGDGLRKRQGIIRRCLSRADHVIVSNEDTRRALAALVARPYEYIPANAVELAPMPAYRLPQAGRLDMVAVGALVPMRPYNLVLDAIATIPAKARAGLSLTFIGSGRTEVALKAQTKRLGLEALVHFLGNVSREATLARMSAAHLLVFPSLRDSGSSSVAEAMTMGLPVLGFDLAGPGAMLAKGGGLVVKAQNPGDVIAQLTAAMARLLADPSELTAASLAGQDAARELFDWPRRIVRLEQLYRSAMDSKRNAA